MHEHNCGAHCYAAARLESIVNKRRRTLEPEIVPVKSWCRICGVPVLLEVLNDYDMAVRHFYALDDTPMVHKGVHAETGGWGITWRLDHVLSVVFPRQHTEDLWPMVPWWDHQHGEPESEDQGVLVMTGQDKDEYADRYMDYELRLLEKYVNEKPRDPFQLEDEYGEVWSEDEVGQRFEVLGFRGPFAIARCILSGSKGSLIFQNTPRFYFGWDPDRLI